MTLGGSPSKPPCKKPALEEEREPVLQTDDRREEEMEQEEEETSREVEKEDSSKNTSPPKQPPSCKTALETDDRREEEMEQEEETSREVEKEDSSNNTSPPKQPPTTREPALKTPTGREVEMMESRVSSSKALNKRLTRRQLQNIDTIAPAPKVLDFCAGGEGELCLSLGQVLQGPKQQGEVQLNWNSFNMDLLSVKGR